MKPGDPLPALAVPDVGDENVVAVMQVMGDSNPIHVDAELARSLGLRGAVNQGPANLAYVVNLLIGWAGGPGTVRNLRFRFSDVVVPGDRLRATGTVIAVRGDEVDCAFELRSPGRTHLTGTATLVIARA